MLHVLGYDVLDLSMDEFCLVIEGEGGVVCLGHVCFDVGIKMRVNYSDMLKEWCNILILGK